MSEAQTAFNEYWEQFKEDEGYLSQVESLIKQGLSVLNAEALLENWGYHFFLKGYYTKEGEISL